MALESKPINHLYYFNAHTKNDDEVIRTFISRKETYQGILQRISDEDQMSIPQHYILIGSRGMGKTTLLRRLEIEFRTGKLSSTFIPILFPEEQYNIDRLSKFWLNTLDALADTFDHEHNQRDAEILDKKMAEIKQLENEGDISDRAFEVFVEICKKNKRRPVFLIDNIDMLFESISSDQKFKLRKILTSNQAPIFVGASAENPKESSNYDAPFFDAFDNIYLSNLSREEMRSLLLELANQTGKGDALNSIYMETAQLDALHNLSGGNPRVAVFMFQLIINGLSDKIFENLNALLDLITPLYKSNFEQLPKQAQIVVDSLALNWDPCDLDKLSQLTMLANNQLSSQLDRLIKMGWVERGSRFSEEKQVLSVKNKNYSIRERFFNIWYIMRRASRRERGNLKSLTCFLETFYTPQHLLIEKERIMDLIRQNLDHDQITYALALSRAHNAEEIAQRDMEQAIYRAIIEKTEGDHNKIAEYIDPESVPEDVHLEYITSSLGKVLKYAEILLEEKKFEKAIQVLSFYQQKKGQDEFIFAKIGGIFEERGLYKEAEKAYKSSIKADPVYGYGLARLGKLYELLKKNKEAERYLLRAISAVPEDGFTLNALATFYNGQNRLEEAEERFKELIIKCPQYAFGWSNLADFLINTNRLSEAKEVLEQGYLHFAEEQFIMHSDVRIKLVEHRYEEAIITAKRLVEIAPVDYNWAMLGKAYHGAKQLEEAREAFNNAVDLGTDSIAFCRAAADISIELKDVSTALSLYLKFTAANPGSKEGWLNLGRTYHYSLLKTDEALEAYRKALDIDSDYTTALINIGQLYEFGLNDFDKAKQCYQRALELDRDLLDVKARLADLLILRFKDYAYAKSLYNEILDVDGQHRVAIIGLTCLLRDRLGEFALAKDFLSKVENPQILKSPIVLIQQAVFSAFEDNWGQSKEFLTTIFEDVTSFSQLKTQNLYKIFEGLAVLQKLGFGEKLIALFEDRFTDGFYRPILEAIKGLQQQNAQYFLNLATEIKSVTEFVYSHMQTYLEDFLDPGKS